ncbi:MAG: VOC family protein [Solirubrobacteraceae bacterium]|nr:VOC family protein [Solirubrobacteraceae bacterium]
MTETATALRKIGTICIPTRNQDEMLAFYTEKLGLELREETPFGPDNMRWIEVALPGTETTIALAPPPPNVPTGGMQTGILFETADVDATHAELKAAGVDVDPEVSRMGDPVPPMFWLRDPDGNVLMINEYSR